VPSTTNPPQQVFALLEWHRRREGLQEAEFRTTQVTLTLTLTLTLTESRAAQFVCLFFAAAAGAAAAYLLLGSGRVSGMSVRIRR